MTDTPNNTPEEDPASQSTGGAGEAFEGFSQDDVDAALAAAEGANAPAPSSSDRAEAVDDFDNVPAPSQADIDAAFAAAEAGDGGESNDATAAAVPAANDLVNEDGSPKLDSQGRPFDDAAAAMAAAIAEEKAAAAASAVAAPPPAPMPANAQTLELPDFAADDDDSDAQDIGLLNDVKLDVKIELGRANIYIDEVLKLSKGSVVELDKLAGDPVDVIVNDRLVARGEVLVLNDNFCVRISEIMVGQDTVASGSAK